MICESKLVNRWKIMKYELEKTREETGMYLKTSITIKSINRSILQSYNLKTYFCSFFVVLCWAPELIDQEIAILLRIFSHWVLFDQVNLFWHKVIALLCLHSFSVALGTEVPLDGNICCIHEFWCSLWDNGKRDWLCWLQGTGLPLVALIRSGSIWYKLGGCLALGVSLASSRWCEN